MKFGIVITTYNSPVWLEKVLWGYENQTDQDFQIIIADDGSGQATAEVINAFKSRGKLDILHIWHTDEGFRKTQILNKAMVETKADYLFFTDGDCVPRSDLVAVHKRSAKPGHFCSGGYYKLTMEVSHLLDEEAIKSGQCFNSAWLVNHGQTKSYKSAKLKVNKHGAKLLNFLTPTKATFNGCNSAAFKEDIIAINGFDERMQYGGLDRELGERLMNYGIQPIQVRYSAICIHLDHKRGYATDETWKRNNAIRKIVKKDGLVWTNYGIKK